MVVKWSRMRGLESEGVLFYIYHGSLIRLSGRGGSEFKFRKAGDDLKGFSLLDR